MGTPAVGGGVPFAIYEVLHCRTGLGVPVPVLNLGQYKRLEVRSYKCECSVDERH